MEVSTDRTRRVSSESVYGSIAVAVVCVAWDGDDVRELALAVTGYSVTLWLAHIYAGLVPGGWESHTLASVGRWARHEWPHLAAAFPALAVIAACGVLGVDPLRTSDLALAATILNLLGWELAALRPRAPSVRALALAVLLDVAVLGVLVGLRVLTK